MLSSLNIVYAVSSTMQENQKLIADLVTHILLFIYLSIPRYSVGKKSPKFKYVQNFKLFNDMGVNFFQAASKRSQETIWKVTIYIIVLLYQNQ